MKNNTIKIILIAVVLLATQVAFSQGNPPPPAPPPPGLPIDGGLLTLLAVAFGYGINKLRDKK